MRESFPAQLPTNAAGLVVHALALEGRESTDLRLRAVSRFELVGGVQHMVPQTLARGYQGAETLLPAQKLIVVILATHPDPVPFKLAAQALQLWEHLCLERIVPVQVRLRQLTHDVCVDMDGWHGKSSLL